MDADKVTLLRNGIETYLKHCAVAGLEPSESFIPYDFDQIDRHQWYMLGNAMVRDELREITNILNGWHGSLRRWHAWNRALSEFSDLDAWDLRREYVEALASQCLLQPSATRDALIFTATNAIHQVRLALGGDYCDYMEGDPEVPGEPAKHLTRRRKVQRLKKLMRPWPKANQFFSLLSKIDDEPYRQATSDYRNRSSHAIGPRLAVGITHSVTRTVSQDEKMVQKPDGSFELIPIPGKMVVRYGFGGTPPLDMEKVRTTNLNQYRHASECFNCYRELLSLAIADMPPVRQ